MIDHLVIGATTLAQGVTYVKEQLGVDIPKGGVHTTMGTHNHLMQLGESLFLEVIAINPDGKSPKQPRWYGLDDPYVRKQLAEQPRLLTWVVNTPDIKMLTQKTFFSFGGITPVSRGNLNWLFGLPQDGRLFAAGLLPYLIEWQTDKHPAHKMPDLGCSLHGLQLHHANTPWLETVLTSIEANDLITIRPLAPHQAPYIEAKIRTPLGIKTLSSKLA
ncbi:MAG: VOC family protein [Arenicellales bacterium]